MIGRTATAQKPPVSDFRRRGYGSKKPGARRAESIVERRRQVTSGRTPSAGISDCSLPYCWENRPIPVGRKFTLWECNVTPADCACQEINTICCISSNDGLDAGWLTFFPQSRLIKPGTVSWGVAIATRLWEFRSDWCRDGQGGHVLFGDERHRNVDIFKNLLRGDAQQAVGGLDEVISPAAGMMATEGVGEV